MLLYHVLYWNQEKKKKEKEKIKRTERKGERE